jgi:CTP:molybdopterin cytidylyltransferase MocA
VADREVQRVKAVALVGGFGTQLRPLTETVEKELLPLVDRPILDHTLDRLVRHGVLDVVMSSPYLEAVDVADGAHHRHRGRSSGWPGRGCGSTVGWPPRGPGSDVVVAALLRG